MTSFDCSPYWNFTLAKPHGGRAHSLAALHQNGFTKTNIWNTVFAHAEHLALNSTLSEKKVMIYEKNTVGFFFLFKCSHYNQNWLEISKTPYTAGKGRNGSAEGFTQWQLATKMIVGSSIKWTFYIKLHCQFSSSKGLVLDIVNAYGHCTAHKVIGLENITGENMALSANVRCSLKSSIFILMYLHKSVW